MKKWVFILTAVLVWTAAAAGPARGGDDSRLETYYNKYISGKIADCSRTASIFSKCCNTRMKKLVEMRASQARFYKENREKLVKEMLANGVGEKPYKIDYFLISRFQKSRH